jgi:hypothetical protein
MSHPIFLALLNVINTLLHHFSIRFHSSIKFLITETLVGVGVIISRQGLDLIGAFILLSASIIILIILLSQLYMTLIFM